MTTNYKDRISAEWQDIDGYWIELKSGWQDNSNPHCHSIREDTKKDAHEKAKGSVPCDCRYCRCTCDKPWLHCPAHDIESEDL